MQAILQETTTTCHHRRAVPKVGRHFLGVCGDKLPIGSDHLCRQIISSQSSTVERTIAPPQTIQPPTLERFLWWCIAVLPRSASASRCSSLNLSCALVRINGDSFHLRKSITTPFPRSDRPKISCPAPRTEGSGSCPANRMNDILYSETRAIAAGCVFTLPFQS